MFNRYTIDSMLADLQYQPFNLINSLDYTLGRLDPMLIDPNNPSMKIESIYPVDPIIPIEPIKPSEPINPILKIDPIDQNMKIESIYPVDPIRPIEPINPNGANNPGFNSLFYKRQCKK